MCDLGCDDEPPFTIYNIDNVKYIEIDSTYRNRNQYPEPAEFAIKVGSRRQVVGQENAITAADGVSTASPLYRFKGNVVATTGKFAGGIPGGPTLQTSGSSNVDNFIKEQYWSIKLQVKRQLLTVIKLLQKQPIFNNHTTQILNRMIRIQ